MSNGSLRRPDAGFPTRDTQGSRELTNNGNGSCGYHVSDSVHCASECGRDVEVSLCMIVLPSSFPSDAERDARGGVFGGIVVCCESRK